MKPLRIAQIAPLIESVPPAMYGGTERVVYHLTEELVERGHDVTLFASGDSRTSATLCSPVMKSLRLTGQQSAGTVSSLYTLAMVYETMAGKFDIIHSHVEFLTFPYAAKSLTPTVFTFHGRLDFPETLRLLRMYRNLHFVSISDSQRAPARDLNWQQTVYHGYPEDAFGFSDKPSDYFLYLGRLSPEKAPHEAIIIAKECGVRLKIAAKVDPVDQAYFAQQVAPLLDHPLIEYLGEVDESGKIHLLRHARALLNTINWPEPFGLVMIESLACGTPVIVRRCGSAPEIIEQGKTGFICQSREDFVRAVRCVGTLKRELCRKAFEDRFTRRHMADGYEQIYNRLLNPDGVQSASLDEGSSLCRP